MTRAQQPAEVPNVQGTSMNSLALPALVSLLLLRATSIWSCVGVSRSMATPHQIILDTIYRRVGFPQHSKA